MYIMQYVDCAVPKSAGNTITYRLNVTSGSFNMVRKPTNVQKCLRVSDIILYYMHSMGSVVALWLKHYDTNRQVAGSFPDNVIGIFQ